MMRKSSFKLSLCMLPLLVMAIQPRSSVGFMASPQPPKTPVTRSSLQATSVVTAANDDNTNTYKQQTLQVELDSGVSMQVLTCTPEQTDNDKEDNNNNKPVLLFLHGSFHAGWCWMEQFGPYFASKGFTVVAPSWRGTGGTYAGDGVKKVKIGEHVEDLVALLEVLPKLLERNDSSKIKPVVISHSFGGLAVMKYLEYGIQPARDTFAGIVLMCSVPPSGNGKMTLRFLQRSLIDSWKITAGFAMKKCLDNAKLCRELFFGGEKITDSSGAVIEDYGVSDEDVERYKGYFKRDSQATIDLLDLAKQLPSVVASPEDGSAPFVKEDQFPPCMVLGAQDDFIVDKEGNEETARYFGLSQPTIVDSPHDVMLGAKWKNAAETLEQWIVEHVMNKDATAANTQ